MTTISMQDLLKKYGSSVKGFTRGEKVQAKILEINKKSAAFDVGGKAEGVLKDLYFQEARDYLRTLKVGDTVNALVMEPENKDGNVVLSLRHAATDSLWERIKDLKAKGTIVYVSVKASNQSGLLVDFEGISGFVPASQIGKELLKKIDNAPETIKVKVTEIDKSKKKVVFSEKAVSEAKEIDEIEKATKMLKVGDIYKGKITTVTNFGVFVEFEVGKTKIEGLVHNSETSWERGIKSADSFKVGQEVKVKIIDIREGRIALSIKQSQVDPWEDAIKKFKVDDKVKGKVVRNSDFGTFVQLEPGVEGLVHITKIPPATKLNIGDEVNCYIEEIDTKNKKLSLGLILSSKPIGYK
jgi:ribosomal protein S1